MNPTPVTICAAMRAGSLGPPILMDNMVNSAAPTQTG